MRLTIVGGGGFRVPLVLQALHDAGERAPITEVVLHDVDPDRLRVMAAVWAARRAGGPVRSGGMSGTGGTTGPAGFTLTTSTDLDDALRGAAVVFSAIRVGGAAGRVRDERDAMAAGLLGQETIGAGGLTYALRTVPVADELAASLARVAPQAWCLNFTNPAGLVTEAMRARHARTVGICDTPIGLVRRALRALRREPAAFDRGEVAVDYAGLNHLGWLLGLRTPEGADLLPGLLADDAALGTLEEVRLIGADWVRAVGALPAEYVYYYLHGRRSRAALAQAATTRGEDVTAQQRDFYAAALAAPDRADGLWRAAHAARDASYMATERAASGAGERDEGDLGGGYHEVAVDLMCALVGDEEHRMVLDVPNRHPDGSPVVPGLDADTVVEVPVLARRDEVTPLPLRRTPSPEDVALMARVRAAERLMTQAARSRGPERRRLAWRSLAAHPVVADVTAARAVLDAATR